MTKAASGIFAFLGFYAQLWNLPNPARIDLNRSDLDLIGSTEPEKKTTKKKHKDMKTCQLYVPTSNGPGLIKKIQLNVLKQKQKSQDKRFD